MAPLRRLIVIFAFLGAIALPASASAQEGAVLFPGAPAEQHLNLTRFLLGGIEVFEVEAQRAEDHPALFDDMTWNETVAEVMFAMVWRLKDAGVSDSSPVLLDLVRGLGVWSDGVLERSAEKRATGRAGAGWLIQVLYHFYVTNAPAAS